MEKRHERAALIGADMSKFGVYRATYGDVTGNTPGVLRFRGPRVTEGPRRSRRRLRDGGAHRVPEPHLVPRGGTVRGGRTGVEHHNSAVRPLAMVASGCLSCPLGS